MYIYNKRSRNKQVLSAKGKMCPSCKSTKMKLTEPGRDRVTFTCQDCGAISTFTNIPNINKKKEDPVKQFSTLTLRDRSIEKQETPSPKAFKNETIQSILNVIRTAMSDKVIISFDYIASDNKKSARNVEPYKITSKNNELVLFAYDLESSGIRTFKIKNISYIEKQPYAYEPRYKLEDKLKEKHE